MTDTGNEIGAFRGEGRSRDGKIENTFGFIITPELHRQDGGLKQAVLMDGIDGSGAFEGLQRLGWLFLVA